MVRFCFTSFNPSSRSTASKAVMPLGSSAWATLCGRQVRVGRLGLLELRLGRPAHQEIPAALETRRVDHRVVYVSAGHRLQVLREFGHRGVLARNHRAHFGNGAGALASGLQPERSESSALVIFGFPLPSVSAYTVTSRVSGCVFSSN